MFGLLHIIDHSLVHDLYALFQNRAVLLESFHLISEFLIIMLHLFISLTHNLVLLTLGLVNKKVFDYEVIGCISVTTRDKLLNIRLQFSKELIFGHQILTEIRIGVFL